jgi:sodium-dependent phosphate cotransporter
MVVIFLFSIELMGKSFASLGREVAESILLATSNPFIGLFIGLLVTALIQSSSTITTMVVAMVASGSLSLTEAVPIIMGANIGTTLTSTIVSLAYINKREEFKRAIAAGTVHDFFNIFTILILFPLEYRYGFISWLSQGITMNLFPNAPVDTVDNFGFRLFEIIPVTSPLINFIDNPYLSIGLSFILLFGSIKFMSTIISKMLMGENQDKLNLYIFDKSFRAFGWGILLTGAVQSSSVTTSLIVPFAATGRIRMDKVMAFVLGANIGTTITAFVAVIFQSEVVVSIAVTHLLINVIGVLIFLPIPFMGRLLTGVAEIFGEWTMNRRLIGFLYIIGVFFLLPFTLIYANRATADIKELTYVITENNTTDTTLVIAKFIGNKRLPELLEPTVPESENNNIQNIYRNNNILFIDKAFFMINQPGFCWDDDKGRGKFRVCIDEIIPSFSFNNTEQYDSVYVFKKEFYDPTPLDSISYRFLISVPANLMILTEKLDKNNQVIRSERLLEVSE